MLFQKQIGITFIFYEFSVKMCCPYLTTLVSGSPIIQNGKLVGDPDIQKLDSKLTDALRQNGVAFQLLLFGLIAHNDDFPVLSARDFLQKQHFENIVGNFVVLRLFGLADMSKDLSHNAVLSGIKIGLHEGRRGIRQGDFGVVFQFYAEEFFDLLAYDGFRIGLYMR